jgi:hypothetical protein
MQGGGQFKIILFFKPSANATHVVQIEPPANRSSVLKIPIYPNTPVGPDAQIFIRDILVHNLAADWTKKMDGNNEKRGFYQGFHYIEVNCNENKKNLGCVRGFSKIMTDWFINYPFIEMRNSSLFLVCFIFSSRNSIASWDVMSLMNLRSIQTRCMVSGSISRSSRRVPEAGTSIAG